MQCGDDARLLLRRQHGARKDRSSGMRHGVVDVENIELVIAAHFRHFHRKWQCIVGIFEKSVVIDRDRMKKKSGCSHRPPKWPPVTDEMNFVSAPRQLFSKRRSKNAAPAHGWITGDANLQWASGIHFK